jgi:aryl-alcohol dehydrogenase-like predicted oxidoreductase
VEYRLLGRTGVRVSPLCLGALNFGGATDEPTSIRLIHAALDAGINLLDTADIYHAGQSEVIVGKALRGRRDQVVLATKVHGRMGEGPNDQGNSRLHILRACDDSLRRLDTDHIDLYQIHRPSPDIPVDETLGALTDLVRAGKVRYIGCSTHPAWLVMEALAVSERHGFARYVSEQPPYNLLDRRIENELVPLALRHHLALLPWAPLAQGVLAGRYSSSTVYPADSRAARLPGSIYAERVTPAGVAAGAQFRALAARHGKTAAQLALLWCMDQPAVTAPVMGPRTLEQLTELLPTLEMRLSDEERAACDALNPPGSAIANFHNTAPWMKLRIPPGGGAPP